MQDRLAWSTCALLLVSAQLGCSDESTPKDDGPAPTVTAPVNVGSSAGSNSGGASSQGMTPPTTQGGTPTTDPGMQPAVDPGNMTPGAGDPGMTMDPTMGMAGSGAVANGGNGGMTNTPFTGPLDGDPSKPMVEIPGIPCGPPRAGFGVTPPSVKISDRDVVVAYPCAHEGAAVTFFLFLHGTLDEGIKVGFTMNAWPVHELVDSHNMIVVVPKAVGNQWGNGDNGVDKPHLYDVVDWVYATFGDKFNIRSMWAQGGSWGAFYLASQFACDPRFEGKLKGVQLVVGGGCPACSDRLSCVVLQQELEKGGGNPVSDDMKEMLSSGANIDRFAMGHGCMGKMGPTDVGNTKYWQWPSCDPGWVHSYYLGPGQHADAWDKMAVLKATEEIKSTEQ